MIPLHTTPLKFKEIFTFPKEDYVVKLKDLIRANFGKEHIVFTADGRNAIYLALKTMNLREEDEILIPAYVCHAVRAVVEAICKPVCVDVDKRTFNIDPQEIEQHITRNTRAILVAHQYGNACLMDKIIDIAKANHLLIIEDAAQALGGKYHGKMIGSFGDFTVFSFRFTKDITSFRGGVLLTNERLAPYLKSVSTIRVFPWLFVTLLALKQIRFAPAFLYSPLKRRILFPFFSQSAAKFNMSTETLSNYQCYLLYQQLTKMNCIIEKRKRNAAHYSERLGDVITIPAETAGGEHTYYRYTIQVNKRNELCDYLLKHGIEADKMYNYSLARLPNSLNAAEKNLNIPVHHELSHGDIEKVIGAIREFKRVGWADRASRRQ
ncbi:DegT/DnrJ/EryC1/StrS family aminotransferase [Chloroflexota bacterium]